MGLINQTPTKDEQSRDKNKAGLINQTSTRKHGLDESSPYINIEG